jgi:hypothetical protein
LADPTRRDTPRRTSVVQPLSRLGVSQPPAIAIGIFALALGVYCWQLSVPEVLSFYDSGVYLAASMHFASGVLPYKDFVFVQPPGILLLMSPVAWFSRIFGTHDGFQLVRTVSAVVTALNASLLAWMVRRRGRVAMLVAGVGLALLPVARYVSTSLELDPYCILFVLLGSLIIIREIESRDRPSSRALAIGGVVFGLAALIKLWAFFPFLALALCLMPRCRGRIVTFVGAAGGCFLALSLPFFILAPHNFYSEVFSEQLLRKASLTGAGDLVTRLRILTGFGQTLESPRGIELLAIFVIFGLLLVIAYRKRVDHDFADNFLLVAAIVTTCGLLLAPETYPYYGYFSAPFLLGALGVAIGRIVEWAGRYSARAAISVRFRQILSGSLVIAGSLLIVGLVLSTTTIYSVYSFGFGTYTPWLSGINRVIPEGSCVVYSEVAYGLYENRTSSTNTNCPSVVDPSGMWLAWGYQLIPGAPPFVAQWKSYFESSQYVVENAHQSSLIPWDKQLVAWFGRNYHLVFQKAGIVYIYAKNASS